MFTVNFSGIVCHVDPRGPYDKFGKRVILVRGDHRQQQDRNGKGHNGHNGHSRARKQPADEHVEHIPYVEIEANDLLSLSFRHVSETYTRDFTDYIRFDLDGEEVIIDPIDRSFGYQVVDTFRELVPSMSRIAPDIVREPREECFDPTPEVVAGYYDVKYGMLMAGPREQLPTRFRPLRDWPDQRNASSTMLLLRLQPTAPPVIKLRSISNGTTRKITLKLGSYGVTIGNEPLDTIRGTGAFAGGGAEHFGLFYGLSPDVPSEQPVPSETSTQFANCVPTNWP